jgi:hypothetical protein
MRTTAKICVGQRWENDYDKRTVVIISVPEVSKSGYCKARQTDGTIYNTFGWIDNQGYNDGWDWTLIGTDETICPHDCCKG